MAWRGPFTLSPRVLPSTRLARECRVLLVTHRRCSMPRLASTHTMLWHPPRKAVEGHRCQTILYINQIVPRCRSIFSIFHHHHQIITAAFPTCALLSAPGSHSLQISRLLSLGPDISLSSLFGPFYLVITIIPTLPDHSIEINEHASHSGLHRCGWRRKCFAWWIWRARSIPSPSSIRIWHWLYFRNLELDYSCAIPVKLVF